MARPKTLSVSKQHATKDIILELLRGFGSLLVEVYESGESLNHIRIAQTMPEWEQYYPSSIERQLNRLLRKGLVTIEESKNGPIVAISDHGKTEILRYDLNDMHIPDQKKWDGNWRMVIFDIPKNRDEIRAQFRNHLKSLGFYQMQKSVYVYPYPCAKHVQYLREVYGIPHSVKLATISDLENDEELRNIFGI